MNTHKLLRAISKLSGRSRFSSLAKTCSTAAALVLCAGFAWAAAGTKVQMSPSSGVPDAQGEITVKQASNGNFQLDITTEHLVQPSALTPAENVYVVWLQQPDENPLCLGEMRVDKNLSGELRTITAFKQFKIFITAEQSAQEITPQAQTVLSADVVE